MIQIVSAIFVESLHSKHRNERWMLQYGIYTLRILECNWATKIKSGHPI